MTIAAKHFDPQLGVDIHAYSVPPGTFPTPYIGLVFDPFDYIPVLGSTLEVNGLKQATAGTSGIGLHIPIGTWTPLSSKSGGPQYDQAEIFMGSKTVLADGEPFSRVAMPVLDCNVVGLIPPFRANKAKKTVRTLTAPTAINLSISSNVHVGGSPAISWTTSATKDTPSALGKFSKKRDPDNQFWQLRRHIFRDMDPGIFKCRVLRGEPVDIRDGSVLVAQEDFRIPGRLPLVWTRKYRSSRIAIGACGHGWKTPADICLEIHENGFVLFDDGQTRAWFSRMPEENGEENAQVEWFNGARLILDRNDRHEEAVVRTKQGLYYRFVLSRSVIDRNAASKTQVLRIERIEDAHGNYWKFERQSGHLVRIVENEYERLQGRFIEVSSHDGRIQRMQLYDPDTGLNHPLVIYRYNASSDLIAVLDALRAARTYQYDHHRMLRHTDRTGVSFYYAYDKQWRVVRAWGDNRLYDYSFSYDALLRETEIVDSLGNLWRVRFDENMLPLCEIDPLDGVTTYEYDEIGHTIGITDPGGLRIEFSFDAHGNLLELVRPDKSVFAYQYDAYGRAVVFTDPCGQHWTRCFNDRGLLIEQIDPTGAISRCEYDASGLLVTYINPRGAATHMTYCRHGQLLAKTDVFDEITEYRRGPTGCLSEQTDVLGRRTEYEYDKKGRLLRIVRPDGTCMDYEYDAEDRVIRYVDGVATEIRFEYSGTGRLAKCIQSDGSVLAYHYDTEERLVGVINSQGALYELKRDALGRVVEEVDYWGQSTRYRYDASGRLYEKIDALDRVIQYDTDKLGRVLRKAFPDPENPDQKFEETFAYDKYGRVIESRNRNRHIKRKYDATGNLIEEEQDGFRVQYAYDEVGNRVFRKTSSNNVVRYEYDKHDRPMLIQVNDEPAIRLHYDSLDRLVNTQFGKALRCQYQYDSHGNMTAQKLLHDTAALFETWYDYDSVSNLIQRSDSVYGDDCYRYDALRRLITHTDPAGEIRAYLPEMADGWLPTHVQETEWQRAVGDEFQMEYAWLRIGEYDERHYVFDRAGHLVVRNGGSDGTLSLLWDASGRLVESRRDGQVTQYGYDPLGRRVFKRDQTHTTWFYWDGDVFLGEMRQVNDAPDAPPVWVGNTADLFAARQRHKKLTRLYGCGREYVHFPGSFMPMGLIDREATQAQRQGTDSSAPDGAAVLRRGDGETTDYRFYHYQLDPNGCPIRMTDSQGRAVWQGEFEGWGQSRGSHDCQVANPWRLQGQYHDSETGLHYNRFRYYDPSCGQFVSQDPIGLAGGANIYAYAPNVFSWIDPLGLSCMAVRTSDLAFTRSPSKPRDQMGILLGTIGTNAIEETIRVVDYMGGKYRIDGHHRFFAAGELGIAEVAMEWIELPYQGYQEATDLFGEVVRMPDFWRFL